MVELMSAWSNESIFVNPAHVVAVKSYQSWVYEIGKFFHVAGWVRIELAIGDPEGNLYREIVVGNIREIAAALSAAEVAR